MTDGMALSKPPPQDMRERAETIVALVTHGGKSYTLHDLVELGIMSERRRCGNIIDAEAEWGGDIREAYRKINSGERPRRIPGYNSPSDA